LATSTTTEPPFFQVVMNERAEAFPSASGARSGPIVMNERAEATAEPNAIADTEPLRKRLGISGRDFNLAAPVLRKKASR
jgi:hypothetical protein